MELLLNGESLGRKTVEYLGNAKWMVPYQPGKLLAIGYNNGEKVIEDQRVTTGEPYALVLKQENLDVKANGQDIVLFSCYCIDENGLEVPTATPYVRFAANHLGTVVGTGSDICDHNPVTDTQRRMRAGRISVAVKVKETAGDLKVYAEAKGLKSAVAQVVLK